MSQELSENQEGKFAAGIPAAPATSLRIMQSQTFRVTITGTLTYNRGNFVMCTFRNRFSAGVVRESFMRREHFLNR